ncbi:benzoyl-CoA-dihydrodiol lyase [Phaeobacter gallaeciensis]|uniref:Benzoyl-CoA-dihydrodiol lyase n=2 Tax=Roseobacteraceae TaxID=2854170 RepID=A0A366WUH0_9RHOB|nr:MULTISPECIES: 2,3-epoxybenzoyl-CoA dihydrolase [Roseobacteraceae]MBT3142023.1 2,3-epoxybenzoyl-CoA dihydrolase [Falsiruegeria litorea]MBT8168631.1 2,3-epoxybenzoyl-CoA dihydrolase [Falsiruegeria litorea]RBW53898.1 benzoyl-CoA-dihydrodiol lyase [Phaeobacter gallaeciensis]
MSSIIDFQTDPSKYRHWKVEYDGEIANLFMDVDETAGLFPGYELKLNSYDLGVDIELADVVQRMRFEHPEVKVVVMRSAKDKVFCAGANIRMLGGASHAHKVNFCKFTNETRNTFEAAEADSGQNYIAAVKGACAGGGYELALACNHIMLTNDSTSSVALPEVPLLAVLPGTGGLTRVTDKRKVRRDLADVFCSVEEGVKGQRAVDWRLVDEVFANSKFDASVQERAQAFAASSTKVTSEQGVELSPLSRSFAEDGSVTYSTVEVALDRAEGRATITINGPEEDAPASMQALIEQGAQAYMLRLARELDDAILHLRLNERELGLVVFRTQGDAEKLIAHEALLTDNADHWLANEILKYWKRVLKRVDMTSRSLVALVEHGSCFAGVLAELLWSVDRSYMMLEEFEGDNRPLAAVTLTNSNFSTFPMGNDLTRLQTRFLGAPEAVETAQGRVGEPLEADAAEALGLITYAFDDIDWEDEVRLFMEERASFSPDAMTGMEANLRFAGPETMETRIFGRLTAWQNWIFQRPNAVGEEGALQRYGTGVRGEYNMERV